MLKSKPLCWFVRQFGMRTHGNEAPAWTQALDDVDGDLAGSLPEGTQLQQLLLGRGQAATELAWGGCRWGVVREHWRFVLKMILAQ